MRIQGAHLPAAGLAVLALAAATLVRPFDPAPLNAQGRASAIQSAGGGAGPLAAPDAKDPANAKADLSPRPPVRALTPDEQAKQFWLPPGYRIEPVLSDPLIDSPGQVTFDGNGRMFVVELRGYEQTPDGVDSIVPTGRISAHEDRDGDGTFEHHTVFVDGLLFPRFAMPFGADAILTAETNKDEVWKYTDTNRDGVADRKELFTASFGRGGSLEAQPSNLMWAMDNWLYSTVNSFRMPLDADRRRPRNDGAELVAVGRDAGQSRQGLVPARRQRPAGLLPVPDALRQLRDARSVRAGPRDRLARAAPDWRRAGGGAGHALAGRHGDLRDGRGRERHLPR